MKYLLVQGDNELEIEAERLVINCLNHQYTTREGQQVIVLDEPVIVVTLSGVNHG